MNLSGSKVIIFGGTSGIGLATARLVVDAGAEAVIVGRSEQRLAGALGELPGGVAGGVVDATSACALAAFS